MTSHLKSGRIRPIRAASAAALPAPSLAVSLALSLALSLAVPLALSLAPLSAAQAADGNTVRLRTLDTFGGLVDSPGRLVDVRSGAAYGLSPGGTATVPDGRYAVTTYISSEDVTTLGVRVVEVTGDRTVSFDARNGRRVRFAIAEEPQAFATGLAMVPMISGVPGAVLGTEVPSDGAYAIPMRSEHVTFVAHAVLEKPGQTPSPYRYDVVRRVAGGIPENLTFRASRADMARVDVKVRPLDPDQTGTLNLRPRTTGGRALVGDLGSALGTLPRTVVTYRSPGYRWDASVGLHGEGGAGARLAKAEKAYGPGRHPTQTWGPAVWGPALSRSSGGIHVKVVGGTLKVNAARANCASTWLGGGRGCADAAERSLRLYNKGRLVASGTTALTHALPSDGRWYRLVLETRRVPGTYLSSEVTGEWRFRAKARPAGTTVRPDFGVIRMEPRGLTAGNRAEQMGWTTIALRPVGYDAGEVFHLDAEYSTDRGVNWDTATVVKVGSHWELRLRTPGFPTTISLRATALVEGKQWVTHEIVNAYGVTN